MWVWSAAWNSIPKQERNMLEFGELLNCEQRLSNEMTAAPTIVDWSESRAWRKYIGFSLTSRDANIDADSRVALKPLLDSAVNEESSLAKDKLYVTITEAKQSWAVWLVKLWLAFS